MYFASIARPIGLIFMLLACGEETNPYAGRYRGSLSGADATQGPGKVLIPGQGEGAAVITVDNEAAAKEVATVAKGEAQTTTTQLAAREICAKASQLTQVKDELAVLCINGQVTEAFANALNTPYRGGANPPLKVIKSADVERVSEFLLLAVIEVQKPVSEVLARRERLATGVTTAGNATATQAILSRTMGTGDLINSFDIQFDLNVRVGSINVDNRRILKSDAIALNASKSTVAVISALKPNEADNEDDILATGLSFFLQDGQTTKIISVNHQLSANRGRHPTAEQTALGLGAATMTATFDKLMTN